MAEQDYKELNKYINDVLMILLKQDSFLITNIEEISRLNDTFLDFMDNYELKENYKENHLTFNDIYLLAREIIESIDKKYLTLYDGLIESGSLEFMYDYCTPMGSSFRKITNDNQTFNLIDIKIQYNYIDVVTLIHEFFHYTNHLEEKESINRYLLTEFISIYFEMYAKDYLLEKGISLEEINFNDRLISTVRHSKELNTYELLILAYDRFGSINEKTVNDLNSYICSVSKEDFEEDCKNALDYFKKIENKYKNSLNQEKNYNDEELGFNYSFIATLNYRYVLGTLLAIYARKNSTMDKMIYLNDTITNNTGDFLDILDEIDIDLNKPEFNDELMNYLEEYVIRYNSKKEKK